MSEARFALADWSQSIPVLLLMDESYHHLNGSIPLNSLHLFNFSDDGAGNKYRIRILHLFGSHQAECQKEGAWCAWLVMFFVSMGRGGWRIHAFLHPSYHTGKRLSKGARAVSMSQRTVSASLSPKHCGSLSSAAYALCIFVLPGYPHPHNGFHELYGLYLRFLVLVTPTKLYRSRGRLWPRT